MAGIIDKPHRLAGYDYSQAGAYFVTICTHQNLQILAGYTENGFLMTALGYLATRVWCRIPEWYPMVQLDCFVVMPNHVHGILLFVPPLRTSRNPEPGTEKPYSMPALPAVVGAFKSTVTREWHRARNCDSRIWQSNFYDHIIRSERALQRIQEYIINNPAQWHLDKENGASTSLNPFYGWLESEASAKKQTGFM